MVGREDWELWADSWELGLVVVVTGWFCDGVVDQDNGACSGGARTSGFFGFLEHQLKANRFGWSQFDFV